MVEYEIVSSSIRGQRPSYKIDGLYYDAKGIEVELHDMDDIGDGSAMDY